MSDVLSDACPTLLSMCKVLSSSILLQGVDVTRQAQKEETAKVKQWGTEVPFPLPAVFQCSLCSNVVVNRSAFLHITLLCCMVLSPYACMCQRQRGRDQCSCAVAFKCSGPKACSFREELKPDSRPAHCLCLSVCWSVCLLFGVYLSEWNA